MLIARQTLKLLIVYWKRFLLFVCLTALLCVATGLLGNFLLYGSQAVDPITLVVVDEDNSMETRLMYNVLSGSDAYKDFVLFQKKGIKEATAMLQRGDASAMLVLPPGFAQSVKGGENLPFTIFYSTATPLKSQLVRLYADAFTRILSTSQMGVYTALDYARQYGDSAQYESLFRSANLGYLGLFGQRDRLLVHQTLTSAGAAGVPAYYLIRALLFLIALSPVLLAELLQPLLSSYMLGTLARFRIGCVRLSLGGWAGIFPLYAGGGLLSAGLLWGLGRYFPGYFPPFRLSCLATLLMVAAALAALALLACLARSPTVGRLLLSCVCLAGLLVSGGIVPTDYLSEGVRQAGRFTFQYWAARLVETSLTGTIDPSALVRVLGFGCLYLLAAMAVLGYRQTRRDAL